jgi:hypothetical protein
MAALGHILTGLGALLLLCVLYLIAKGPAR